MSVTAPATGNPARLRVKRRDRRQLTNGGRVVVDPIVFTRPVDGGSMSVTPDPPTQVGRIEDNPTKPWKALAAFLAPAIIAMLDALLKGGKDEWPSWLLLLIAALIAGVSTYIVRNPKTAKTHKRKKV